MAPYAASLAPMISPHQSVALILQMLVLDSFHRGAMFIACNGGVSSVSVTALVSCEARQSGSVLSVSVEMVTVAILLKYQHSKRCYQGVLMVGVDGDD